MKHTLEKIKLLAMDVDGVLTDGTVAVGSDGGEYKRFNMLDGHGIKLWQRAGFKTAIISGRFSKATEIRANELAVDFVYQPSVNKSEAFRQLQQDSQLKPEEIAFIGDDIVDLPIITNCGFGVAVANAVKEVKDSSKYVTSQRGGYGAVREVIEYILKNTGNWDKLLQRYLS